MLRILRHHGLISNTVEYVGEHEVDVFLLFL